MEGFICFGLEYSTLLQDFQQNTCALLMNCRGNGTVVLAVQICVSPVLGLAKLSLTALAHSGAVLCISGWMGADNRAVFWPLLSRADPHQHKG